MPTKAMLLWAKIEFHLPSLQFHHSKCMRTGVLTMGSMHGVISGEALGMLDNFRRS